jgi:hypothetical protein
MEEKTPNYSSKKNVYMGTFHKYKDEVNKRFLSIDARLKLLTYMFIGYFAVLVLFSIYTLAK